MLSSGTNLEDSSPFLEIPFSGNQIPMDSFGYPRNRISGKSLAGTDGNSSRRNRKLCAAFPFPRTPQSSPCRGQSLCLQSFGSSGSMSPGHSWIRRPCRIQVGVRGNGKAGHNLRFLREEFPSVPARLFQKIRFRGYPKESMGDLITRKGYFQERR